MPPGLGDPLTCREVALGTGVCDGCESRTRGVEYHFFGPLMVRTDPQVDPLMRKDFRSGAWKGAGRHQSATNSPKRRMLPTHEKY